MVRPAAARRTCADRQALPRAEQGLSHPRPLPAHLLERISVAVRSQLQQDRNLSSTLVAESCDDRPEQLAARTQQETIMHPTIMSDVAKHRIADWHRQAERDRIARAARAARTTHVRRSLAAVLACRVGAALGPLSGRPPAQPGQAPEATP
jgi:hypothetical protein